MMIPATLGDTVKEPNVHDPEVQDPAVEALAAFRKLTDSNAQLVAPDPPSTGRRTFGIEEEYLLLDARSGRPVDRAAELMSAARSLETDFEHEFFASQIEIATPICDTADAAEAALRRSRADAACAAESLGVVVAGSGLPPVGGDVAGLVTPVERYRQIAANMRHAHHDQYTTGLHVHVEVPSRDAGIEVMARVSRWAPVLLALTANSPLWAGEPTGFASWRHLVMRSWPVHGYPEPFDSVAAYDQAIEGLTHTGVIPDTGLLTWIVRLSERFPTVEFRIADAQLDARDSVAFAVIVRALVELALAESARGFPRVGTSEVEVNAALWAAARDGLSSDLIDPLAGERVPAFALVERMIHTITPELERFGDMDRVTSYVDRLRRTGGPAARQGSVFAHEGMAGLLELYRDPAYGEASGVH